MRKRRKKKSKKIRILLFLVVMVIIAYGYYTDWEFDFLLTQSAPVREENRVTIPTGEVKVSFIDVGQGDATLIRTENYVVLIDTGSRRARDQLKETLREKNVETINLMILTHAHEDHIGNASTIMNYFEVLEVKYPTYGYDLVKTQVWGRTLDAISYHNITVTYPTVGQNRYFDDMRIDILGPLDNMRGINNNSIVLRITHGEKTFMFSGDAEREAERALVNSGKLTEVDVLLVGHHGSRTSATAEFLDILNPSFGIISVGRNNFGHPHNVVLNRLEERNIQIYRTDLLGTIIVISNGNSLNFKY